MKTFEEWIKIANKLFNNKYEYIQQYKKDNKYQFLKIKCKIHGSFHKKIQNHIKKLQGCPKCSKPSKLTNEDFMERVLKIHGDKYEYPELNYTTLNTKIDIKCKSHGIFKQTPKNHLKGQNCPKCKFMTKEDFIEKATKIHFRKYKYDEINYLNVCTKINIKCEEHGIFEQTPSEHLKGNQCYKCSDLIRTTDDFVKKANNIHNYLYSYDKTDYKKSRENIIITCKIHGDFKQKPNDHLNGCGCKKCNSSGFSKISIKWLESIMKKEKIFIQHAMNDGEKEIKINNNKYKFDGYCKDNNTVFEFYGDFFHGNPKIYNLENTNNLCKKTFGELYKSTMEREEIIKKAGYNLITMWESDFIKK